MLHVTIVMAKELLLRHVEVTELVALASLAARSDYDNHEMRAAMQRTLTTPA